jgi:hypothetical protein
MRFLFSPIYWEALLFLICIFGMVAARTWNGWVRLEGLLQGTKADGSTYISPEHAQLLLFTSAVAFQFLSAVLRAPNKVITCWLTGSLYLVVE